MKRKWKLFVKDYLTFTAKDRISLFSIVVIITALLIAPRFFKKPPKPVDHSSFQQELANLKISIDSSNTFTQSRYNRSNYNNSKGSYYNNKKDEVKGELFQFDPNTLDENGWKRLGVKDRTIATIQKFVGKGYTFRQPEDIRKIYGLKPEEADRLIPYITIAPKEFASINKPGDKDFPAPGTKANVASMPKIIDINEADTSALIALPGIGSKLAVRIINFREKLGGFASVTQVAETYALPDSTFQKIKDRLICKTSGIRKIDINSADVNLLKTHPYLKWNIANAIVAYRQQHGVYKSVEDLKKIDIINEELFGKLSPYLIASR